MPPFSKQCLLKANNFYLTFYKTRQLATWLQVSLECQVQTGFQAYSSKKIIYIYITMSFEFFYRTRASTQVEDGNFRLNIRFLEHSSVA